MTIHQCFTRAYCRIQWLILWKFKRRFFSSTFFLNNCYYFIKSRINPSSENQGKLLGTIECSWWTFTISSDNATFHRPELPLGLQAGSTINRAILSSPTSYKLEVRRSFVVKASNSFNSIIITLDIPPLFLFFF